MNDVTLARIAELQHELHSHLSVYHHTGTPFVVDAPELGQLFTLAERCLRHEQLGPLKATSPTSNLRAAFLRGEKVERRTHNKGWLPVVTIYNFDHPHTEFRLAPVETFRDVPDVPGMHVPPLPPPADFPAYPSQDHDGQGMPCSYHEWGLTARDKFAIAALPALITTSHTIPPVTRDDVTVEAYLYADSMLKARTKPIS